MIILHLETSSKNCSVAVSDGETLLCLCEEVSENYKQSESLHTFVQWTLEGAGISLKDLSAVSLGIGPGSYTGLRIGAAAAKGFCFSLGIPLVGIESAVTMAAPFLNNGFDEIITLIDARRMEVYRTVFDGVSGAIKVAVQPEILTEGSFSEFTGRKVLFIGDGAQKASEIINLPSAEFKWEIFPSAISLLKPACEKFKQNQFEDVAYFEPFYLKDFQGTKKKS